MNFLLSTIALFPLCLIGIVLAEAELCEDGTICQNGGKCVPLEKGVTAPNKRASDGKRRYRCDCSEPTSMTRFYAGYECEYPSEDICIYGTAASTGVSFCTNGECLEKYHFEKHEDAYHEGCQCDDGFEGDYCEYILGEAPKSERYNGLTLGLSLVFVGLSAVCGVFIVKMLRRKTSSKNIETVGSGTSGVTDGDVKVHQVDAEIS